MAGSNNQVAEMQGLYGPFTMAERVVQKIWRQADFDRRGLVLTDGRSLQIRSTGGWNLLGGPDFRQARLVIAGREITGDVEVHFHVADWRAHGHEADPAYANVVLHVVLFPPAGSEAPARRPDGAAIPALVLLPLLYRDLEEYASDDALEVITARDEWRHLEELAATPPVELQALLQRKARARWQQKVFFARLRVEKLGWRAAAHQTALEILGYRQNRAAMLAVAAKYPLEVWATGIDVSELFGGEPALWHLQGVRPANHPRLRLQQYQGWVAASPDWPEDLRGLFSAQAFPGATEVPTQRARRTLELGKIRNSVKSGLIGSALGGTRVDNLVCDGFLPLFASSSVGDGFALWFHWYLGDIPARVPRALTKLGVTDGRAQPLCHGYAQGLLGWLLEREGMQVPD